MATASAWWSRQEIRWSTLAVSIQTGAQTHGQTLPLKYVTGQLPEVPPHPASLGVCVYVNVYTANGSTILMA